MNNLLSKYPIPSFEKDFIQDYKNLVISYPKAGRSWLKILLLVYYGLLKEKDIDLNLDITSLSKKDKYLDSVSFIHDGTSMENEEKKYHTKDTLSKEKDIYKNNNVLILIRDPRDIIVSHYFHHTHRNRKEKPYDKSLKDFVYDRYYNIEKIVEFYNIWKKKKVNQKR